MAAQPFTLTLMAPEAKTPAFLEETVAALNEFGSISGPIDWLHPCKAGDVFIHLKTPEAETALTNHLKQLTTQEVLDWGLHEYGAIRQKQLVLADMDSTLLQSECIDELAAFLGLEETMQAITAQTMQGELDFESSLRYRVSLLKGLPRNRLTQLLDSLPYMPGAKTLMATMQRLDAFTAVVSGGFEPFTQRLQSDLNLNAQHANQLHWDENDCLTGTVAEPILGKEAKLKMLRHYSQQLGLPLAASLAVGDGANDLAMLQASGMGVAFRAKPMVAAQATFVITHSDLTALLYLQGLHYSQWVIRQS